MAVGSEFAYKESCLPLHQHNRSSCCLAMTLLAMLWHLWTLIAAATSTNCCMYLKHGDTAPELQKNEKTAGKSSITYTSSLCTAAADHINPIWQTHLHVAEAHADKPRPRPGATIDEHLYVQSTVYNSDVTCSTLIVAYPLDDVARATMCRYTSPHPT